MKLKSLSFKDYVTGWNFSDIRFNNILTLLVGASGVGKTQLLQTIIGLSRVARGRSYNGMEWKADFEINQNHYYWEIAFQAVPGDSISVENARKHYPIVSEKILVNDVIIIERDINGLRYKNEETVKLDNTQSAVSLLQNEEDITPIYTAFKHIYFLYTDDMNVRVSPVVEVSDKTQLNVQQIKDTSLFSPLEKLFLLRKNNLKEFDDIFQKFHEIFPFVEKMDFAIKKGFNGMLLPVLQIKEKNIDSWILQNDISSGMYRTLIQITAMMLAEDGDMILIDEFENGLGVNCINDLADLVIDPEADIQIVMTSHHPYIINAIPVKSWKIITRNNSNVKALNAEDLNIGDHSKHETFMQLIQTSAYKTGRA